MENHKSEKKVTLEPVDINKVVEDIDPRDIIEQDSKLTEELDPETTEEIQLVHCKIQSLEALNLYKFKNLKNLCLRTNLIESISDLESLSLYNTIEEIDLYDNRIKHISKYVNKLTNLTSLDLSFNQIKHLQNIENLEKLENLYLVANNISEIGDIFGKGNFHKLINLELGGNSVAQISGLINLPNLEELWLGKNMIRKFENLQYLKNLKILSIQSNKIKKIEGLEQLENLEELYLSHNAIEEIENLDKNLKLTTLDITANRLTTVKNLRHLTNLTDLWLSFNNIDMTFEQLHEEIGHLACLETIYLERNPIQLKNETSYRRKLVMNLSPSLEKIDATYIK